MNTLQHILTITKLKHAIMASSDTRQVKLLWLLQITEVNNYMTAVKRFATAAKNNAEKCSN